MPYKTCWRRTSLQPAQSASFGHRVMGSLSQLTSIVLPFFSLFNDSVEMTTMSAQNSTFLNATTQNSTASAPTPMKTPTDLSSLFAFLYSFSSLHDYVKLIVLGGAFETLRRLYSASYKSLMDRFFITATFESDDVSYSEHSFPHPPVTKTDPAFRLDDVLAVFSSSVSSVPGFFSQHQRSLLRGRHFGD